MLRSILIVSVLAAAAASGAHAQDRTPDQLNVSVGAVDYSNPAKVTQVYGRLRAAAHEVCDSDGDRGPLAQDADKACEAASLRDAVAQIGQPQLTELAARHDRATTPSTLASRTGDKPGTR